MDACDGISVAESGTLSRCGTYELIRELSRGGTGSVWEGRHVALDRRVAVKVLRTEYATNMEIVARFAREGQAAARIRHPNVAQMLDVGNDHEQIWLVMELLEGEDLDDLLSREGTLAPTRAVDLMIPVISGVVAAHKVGVVHRDLKPGNIFLSRNADGVVTPKIVDFGFSKIHVPESEDEGLTRADMSLGTLSYMPLEQVQAAHDANPSSDQYALAVTLYRCITGTLPFQGRSPVETFKLLSSGTFTRPIERVPSLEHGLDAVIVRAMARTPAERYPTVRAFGAALLPFASEPVQARWARSFGVTSSIRRVGLAPPDRRETLPPPLPARGPETITRSIEPSQVVHDTAHAAVPQPRRRNTPFVVLAVMMLLGLCAAVFVLR